jgi:hypothetical protein
LQVCHIEANSSRSNPTFTCTGNHDIGLDEKFARGAGSEPPTQQQQQQQQQDYKACYDLIHNAKSITYLNHSSTVIKLNLLHGPVKELKVFGSPYSPNIFDKDWAFQYKPDEAAALWSQIPLDADIVVTHTPPKGHVDEFRQRGSMGCSELKESLRNVRPGLAICGHVHEARGANLITWDLNDEVGHSREDLVGVWQDSTVGTKKISKIDLTARGANMWHSNDMSYEENIEKIKQLSENGTRGPSSSAFLYSRLQDISKLSIESKLATLDIQESKIKDKAVTDTAVKDTKIDTSTRDDAVVKNLKQAVDDMSVSEHSGSNFKALQGNSGRLETCIINAAIMATGWPYQGAGGDRYNKPIVVDIDLPVAESEDILKPPSSCS